MQTLSGAPRRLPGEGESSRAHSSTSGRGRRLDGEWCSRQGLGLAKGMMVRTRGLIAARQFGCC